MSLDETVRNNEINLVEMENVLYSMKIDTEQQFYESTSTQQDAFNSSSNNNNNIDNTQLTSNNKPLQQTSNTIVKIEEGQQEYNTSVTIPPKIPKQDQQYIINTKYGQLQLSCDRIISVLIMLLAIITLFMMAFLSACTLILETNTENKTFNHTTQLSKNLIRLNTYYKIIMESEIVELLVEEINETMIDVTSDYHLLLRDVPYTGNTDKYSRASVITRIGDYFNILESNHFHLYNQVIENNYTDTKFFYSNYHPSLVNFTQSLDLALILADKAASNEDEYMNLNAIIDLVLSVFVLIIIIPSTAILLIKSAVNDNKFLEKLKKADARVVIETIADIRLQNEFKELCKEHNQLSKYLFMERVQSFNEICQRVFALQDEIEEGVNLEMSKKMLIEIDQLESKKFELSFELITEYLDLGSDTFLGYPLIGGKKAAEKIKKIFDTQSVHLPENLFKNVQSNVSLNLLPIYKLCKSNQQRKRNQRMKLMKKQQLATTQ
ncbi:predicted protein [Naegleria gruberi]|uniref:Predicted protein n=1 Tax=Naegleria gruberi TaxID=5762 RepID=D2VC11_NAEGR|nr:uncharacterized protein NAEGRDRAFT_66407 [Naegleria gruberi]EFC45575.1 predicted protein [Naegleria gruberi]|eukprot:XP_002678319.1 predicted protein [Naegleria gruberi strain NEG-M]